jgi:hypothetical protein
LIHLSVAIARFIETLLWALLRAGLSLAGIAVLLLLGLGLTTMIVRCTIRSRRR